MPYSTKFNSRIPGIKSCWLGLALIGATPTTAMADDAAVLYEDSCSGCHGEAGMGDADTESPAIAGMNSTYISRQLLNFRSGKRGAQSPDDSAQMMADVAQELSDEDISALSSFIEKLAIQRIEQEAEFAGFRARGLYSGCISCHGGLGEGYPALNAPRLANQHGWYLKKQIADFKNGKRGYHSQDEPGQQMKDMAVKITDEADIDLIVQYIMGLQP